MKTTSKENKQSREERLTKLHAAVVKFFSNIIHATWNTNNVEATITKILICLNTYDNRDADKNPDWVKSLYLAVQEEYKRMSDKGSKQYMESFYNAIEELEATMVRDGWEFVKSAIDDNSVDVLAAFIDVVEKSYRRYNIHNYNYIKSNATLNYRLLSDFDCSFRGDIKKIHNVNDAYFIIETKKFNKNEDVKDWESHFYNIKDGSTYYSSFDDALICIMFGRFSNSVYVLFEQKEKEDKEAEEEKNQKKLKTA